MSDNYVEDKQPIDDEEIGRVNNELNPNPDQVEVQQEIGRVNNELNPDPSIQGTVPPSMQEIGVVNNELNPDPNRHGTVPPSLQEIGVVNNEKADKEPTPTEPEVGQE